MVCPAGQYSFAGAGVCTACASGRFSSTPARGEECVDVCPAGNECPVGSVAASPCAMGKFAAEEGSESCVPCSAAPGFSCLVGSTSAAGVACPADLHSDGGSDVCHEPSDGVSTGALAGIIVGVIVGVVAVVVLGWCVKKGRRSPGLRRSDLGSPGARENLNLDHPGSGTRWARDFKFVSSPCSSKKKFLVLASFVES